MMFRYSEAHHWSVYTGEGWERLPENTRPSDTMKLGRTSLARPTPTPPRPERRCDTQLDYELALVRRVTSRVAVRMQRSVEAIRGRRRKPGLHTARGLVVRCCRSLGVQASPLATFFDRHNASISVYAADLEREMRRRPELRRTFCEISEDERHAKSCRDLFRTVCSSPGTEGIS